HLRNDHTRLDDFTIPDAGRRVNAGATSSGTRHDRSGARKGSGVPVALPCPGSGTLSRMTVVFRPTHLERPALCETEVFDNGERIPDALIHTEDLPKGFPSG